MLRPFRKLVYRDRMFEGLGAILLAYPRGRQFRDDFPWIPQALAVHFEDGASPDAAAIDIAARIVSALAGQLDAAGRSAVLTILAATSPERYEAMAGERLARRVAEPDSAEAFLAQLVGVAAFIARRMAQEGQIQETDVRGLADAIAAALGGPNCASEARALLSQHFARER